MSTYRVFILHTLADSTKAEVITGYVSADKYGPAWQAARALLSDGKPHKDHSRITQFFADAELKTKLEVGHGDDYTVAKIVDCKARNVKLDKAQLQAILADPATTTEQKLAAAQAMVGAPAPAKTPAPAGATK